MSETAIQLNTPSSTTRQKTTGFLSSPVLTTDTIPLQRFKMSVYLMRSPYHI